MTGELAPLTLDTPFKRALGTMAAKDTLKHFLNSLLGEPVEIASIENVEIKSAVTRSVIFDVRCKLASGEKVIIELLKAPTRADFFDRLFGYLGGEYREQWRPGGRTEAGPRGYRLIPVRMVAVLDFLIDRDATLSGSLIQHYHIKHAPKDPTEVPAPAAVKRLGALSNVTFLQLPLAPDELSEDSADVVKWAHLLHHSSRYKLDQLPRPLQHPPFLAAARSAAYDRMTREEREALRAESDALKEWTSLEEARSEAETRAQQEADARAEAEARRAEAETKRAEAETRRAEMEGELERLRKELEKLQVERR